MTTIIEFPDRSTRAWLSFELPIRRVMAALGQSEEKIDYVCAAVKERYDRLLAAAALRLKPDASLEEGEKYFMDLATARAWARGSLTAAIAEMAGLEQQVYELHDVLTMIRGYATEPNVVEALDIWLSRNPRAPAAPMLMPIDGGSA